MQSAHSIFNIETFLDENFFHSSDFFPFLCSATNKLN